MKKILLIFILLAAVQCFIVPRLGHPTAIPPNKYIVQLNDPPRLRWKHVVNDFKPRLIKFVTLLTEWLPVPDFVYSLVGLWGKHVFPYVEIREEIEGMADDVGQPFDRVFFLQFFYEWSQFKSCSAVVLRNNENKILHGRNWDFELFIFFSRMSATVDFMRGNEYVATAEMVVGSSLILTGIKNGEYAVTVNARGNSNEHFIDICTNLLIKNYIPPDFFLRIVLQEAQNFDQALNMLNTTNIATAIYYAISGVKDNQAAIIERDSTSVHGYYQLNETTWFLVQTNYDRNVPDPIHDPRRIPAEKRLEKIGQGITIDQLFGQVMVKWPTFNFATILTFMAIPQTSYRNTSLWYGRNGGPYNKKLDNIQQWEMELDDVKSSL